MEIIRTPHAFSPARSTVVPVGHLLLASTLALAATALGWVLVAAPENSEVFGFAILLGVYGAASAVFIALEMRGGEFSFFDLPTFFTLLAFAEFGVAPLACFFLEGEFNPGFHGVNGSFLRTLALVAAGMAAFWAGCRLVARKQPAANRRPDGIPAARPLSAPLGPPVICALALYAVAFAVKLYLLENFGYDYGASPELYQNHLAAMQVANVVFQVGTYAMVILAIERSFHPFSLERKVFFWVVFVAECFWGLASGMKGNLLQNFLVVAVVSSLAERRLKKRWLLAALLGLVIVYPFSIQYRELVLARADAGIGLDGTTQLAWQALDEAAENDSTPAGWLDNGLRDSVSRLNLLQSVAAVAALGSKGDWLKGSERWWMLPFYPFVPRLVWPSKPILDKGRRFSIALGYGDQTSTAITYPGDLDLEYGLAGVLIGMFVFGLVAKYVTLKLADAADKRRIFIYTGVFMTMVFSIELDAFDFWSTLIRTAVILFAVAWAVYRPSRQTAAVSRREFSCAS